MIARRCAIPVCALALSVNAEGGDSVRPGKTLRRLLFPPYCVSCGELLPYNAEGGEAVLCRNCRGEFETEKLRECRQCGLPQLDCRCIPPLLAEVGVREVIRLAAYRPANAKGCINSIINNNKRTRNCDCFAFLAAQLAPALRRELPPDAIVCFCPRSRRARREHGFDQAEELARRIAQVTGLEFGRALSRRRGAGTAAQKTLGYSARIYNAGRSVGLDGSVDVRGRTVVLVDDVITTGATMSACAQLLLGAGAAEVICVCVAAVEP